MLDGHREFRREVGRYFGRRALRKSPSTAARRVCLEGLEPRRVLANFSPADASALIADISTANANGEADVIDLGGLTFALNSVDNDTDGPNGLPSILSDQGQSLTIRNGVIELAVDSADIRILHVGRGAVVALEDVGIFGGRSPGSGGGIYNRGQLSVADSMLTGNFAFDAGGAVYNVSGGQLTVTSSSISKNYSSYGPGAGIANMDRSTATVMGSVFSENRTLFQGNEGGGVFNSGELTVTDSILSGNSAGVGGGIANRGALNLSDVKLMENTGQYYGGGIYNAAEMTIEGSTVADNLADQGSGGGLANRGTATVVESTISGNKALGFPPEYFGFGGGVSNGGELTLMRSTVEGNSAAIGGGIANYSEAQLSVVDSTISENLAFEGGGVFNEGQLSVTESMLTGNSAGDSGGAIYNGEGGQLTVAGSTFSRNASYYGPGGGIANLDGGAATVTGSTFSENRTYSQGTEGGGIFSSGEMTVTGSTLSGNSAGAGGGIANRGTLNLSEVTLSENAGQYLGGGIYNGGEVRISKSTIAGNLSDQGFGGGLANAETATATITETSISENEAFGFPGDYIGFGGGVLNRGELTLTRSTLAGNYASLGGGVANYGDGKLSFFDSTISGNVADIGGGVLAVGALDAITIVGSTVTENIAEIAGGGIAVQAGDEASLLLVQSTLVAGNVGPNPDLFVQRDPDSADLSPRFAAAFSLIGDAGDETIVDQDHNQIGGGDNPIIDPQLGPLQDNGGPTHTHAPLRSSPAIDAGAAFGAVTDQRGLPRTVEIPGVNDPPPGDGTDIGAVELAEGVVSLTDGVLRVSGSPQADVIEVREIDGLYRVRLNDSDNDVFFDPVLVTRIEIFALGGDDVVAVRTNVDRNADIQGGDGDDMLGGGSGNDRIDGGAGNDLLVGGVGDNTLLGGAGDDQVLGGANDDTIVDLEGNNILRGRGGNDSITAGDGDDVIQGGSGDDVLAAGGGQNTVLGGDGRDEISTGDGNDVIRGGGDADFIDAGGGDDLLFGEAGDDVLLGGDGNDVILGGAGRDVMVGGLGEDRLLGEVDEDLLIPGSTDYDADPAALELIASEWRTPTDYSTRLDNLRSGSGPILSPANVLLDANVTVLTDDAADELRGGTERDWFFAQVIGSDLDDLVLNPESNEFVDLLEPLAATP